MRKILLVLLAFALSVAALSAQEADAEGSEQLDFSFAPRFWGASVGASYALEPPAIEEVETKIIGAVSGAYETVGLYRYSDGSLYGPLPDITAADLPFSRYDVWWQVGVQQGILPGRSSTDDLAIAFAYYRGRFDKPYIDSGLLGSVHTGLAFSSVTEDDSTATKRGVRGEVILQWGPSFLHNEVIGSADFSRTTLSARGFLPLWAVEPRNGRNVFSGYLGAFGAVDWATGSDVPWSVRSSIGTLSERPGMGGSIRGFGTRRFDAALKLIGNVELRTSFRELELPWVLPNVTPGLLLYTDTGYWNDLDQVSPDSTEHSGTLFSSGAGVTLDVNGVAAFVFYTHVLWQPASTDGEKWVPFSLGFGYHF